MITSPNLYAGKSRNEIVAPAIYGGDTVKAGLWQVIPTMLSKYVYHALDFSDALSVGNFCGNGTNTASTLGDVEIELKRFVNDTLICKDNFRGTFQEGNPMPAIDKYVETAINAYRKQLEILRWVGDTTSGITALQPQDGVITQLNNGGTFIPVVGALAANILDNTKVIAELNKALAVVPTDVLYSGDFKIILAPKVFSAFRQAAWKDGNFNAGLTQIQNFAQNTDPGLGSVGSFYNYPIYVATALDTITTAPSTADFAHVALMGNFNGDMSNLVLATDLMQDLGSIQVLDLEGMTGNEQWRLKFDFKQGIGVANQDQIVMYI